LAIGSLIPFALSDIDAMKEVDVSTMCELVHEGMKAMREDGARTSGEDAEADHVLDVGGEHGRVEHLLPRPLQQLHRLDAHLRRLLQVGRLPNQILHHRARDRRRSARDLRERGG
jgi:hypothetical protein